MPVPVSDAVKVPPGTAVIARLPVRLPVTVGVKTTLKVQLLFAARAVPQVLV